MKKLALLFIALLSVSALADDLPRIAVYVTGNVGDDEKKALGTRMLASLVNSGRYKGIERSNSFLAEIEKEQVKQMSGDIDDSQISALGKQFGVKFVCIADLTPAFGSFQVSARIVNVETAEVDFIGESASALKSMDDLASVSDQVVKNMFGGKTTPKPNTERTAAVPEEPKPSILPATVVSRNYDHYFTWRYMPVASPVYLSPIAHNLETGWVWRNGMSLGFDLGFAGGIVEEDGIGIGAGLGLNAGKSFELTPELDFVLGGSLSLWLTMWSVTEIIDENGSFNWIGPFVRLRYRIFELSYRILFGTEKHYDNNNDSEPSSGFSTISQVGVGLYLEGTSGRFGQPSYDYYFAFRYLPITSPVYLEFLAYDIEAGWVWGDGMSFGIDFGLALGDDDAHIGGGFNFGKSLELPHDFNLAVGGSLGIWYTRDAPLFLGPFVRLRYNLFELSYRALFGRTLDNDGKVSSDIGFSNQLGIGIYFEGQKRRK